MQREVLDGVPFWCDKENKVYAYDTVHPPLYLGTKTAAGGVTLIPGWREAYSQRLSTWRAELKPRGRKPKS